jgi:hypothetical protein
VEGLQLKIYEEIREELFGKSTVREIGRLGESPRLSRMGQEN